MKPIDVYILYQFIRRLSKPFNEWDMYKEGIIDDQGNFIDEKSERTKEQLKSYSYFDVLILNLKRLIAKVPGGSSRIATFAAALYLLREAKPKSKKEVAESVSSFIDNIDTLILEATNLVEDEGGVPANNMSGEKVSRKDNPMNVSKILKRKHKLQGCGCDHS